MQDRIDVLHSEVTRLKTRLAADAGDEDLMSFLFDRAAENATDSTSTTDRSYVFGLRQKLSYVPRTVVIITDSEPK